MIEFHAWFVSHSLTLLWSTVGVAILIPTVAIIWSEWKADDDLSGPTD